MSSSARLTSAGLALVLVAAGGAGCGTGGGVAQVNGISRELIVAYDDAHPTGTLSFPSTTYESVTQFALPDGEHRPIRLRFQLGAPGQLAITIYATTLLETPGEALRTLSCDASKEDVSDGTDGRWIVADLGDMKPLKGVVWIGVRKLGGEPTLWASSVASGHAFVRNNDPNNLMGLLPTKRTPMVRIEVAP